jgi:hypothetical protein
MFNMILQARHKERDFRHAAQAHNGAAVRNSKLSAVLLRNTNMADKHCENPY